jgi:flagellum-specific peptidoglycan hydrolase FlgJ
MNDFNRGLMTSDTPQPTKRGPMLEQFMDELSTQNKPNLPLEDRLSSVSDSERSTLMQLAKLVRIGMRLHESTNDRSITYLNLITEMYGGVSLSKRMLVAAVLDQTNPLSPREAKPEQQSRQDMALSLYDRPEFNFTPEPKAAGDTLDSVLAGAFSTRQAQQKQATTFASKADFLAAMTPVAKEVADELGVSHKIILAQAALESGWGAKAKNNAFFGIKSHDKAGSQTFTTHEEVDGQLVKTQADFRQYDTPEDSIRGYGDFLKSNSRYRHFLAAGQGNEDAQLMALQESGYATDSNYAQKLKAIIKGLPSEGSA